MSLNTEDRAGVGTTGDKNSSTEEFVDAQNDLSGKTSSTASVRLQLADTFIGNTPTRRQSSSDIVHTEQLKKRRRDNSEMEEQAVTAMESDEQDADTTVIKKSSSEDLPDIYKVKITFRLSYRRHTISLFHFSHSLNHK
jgi:hypothetical protein